MNKVYNSDLHYGEEKNRRYSKPSPFCQYLTRLCQRSLITGFPIIATTKSLLRKVMKSTVFLLCTGGFVYQATQFLSMYLAYPTVVDITMRYPVSTEMPAITVCSKNRLKRKLLCTLQKDKCRFLYTDVKEFCSMYPMYCRTYDTTPDDIVLGFVHPLSIFYQNNTWEYIEKLGFISEDVIESCAVKDNSGSEKCKDFVDVPAVDSAGYPNNCFAIGSLLGQPEAKPQIISTSEVIIMKLDLHPEEYLKFNDIVQGHMLIHDALSIGNPINDGIMLESGKAYNLYVTQVKQLLLPYPYKTNCTDYEKIWRMNGGEGPANRKMCVEKCKLDSIFEEYDCVDTSISYPHRKPLCERGGEAVLSEGIIVKCTEQCQHGCTDVTYHLRVEVKDFSSACQDSDVWCKQRYIILNFIFNGMEVTLFKHQPKYESVELFSYIGGYMGMWLGISLVSLFDLLETLCYLCLYPLKKRRPKRFRKFPMKKPNDTFNDKYYI